MVKSISLVLFATLLATGGQLLLKTGLDQLSATQGSGVSSWELLSQAIHNPIVVGGLATYAVSAMVYILGLARLDVSIAFPLVGLSYALVPLGAWLLLGETVPPLRWLGVLVTCMGVALVTWTATLN
ncbi:MAG: membrane protein [Coriobacteriia bacterium]